jgi:protein-tyrosine-phosphatase
VIIHDSRITRRRIAARAVLGVFVLVSTCASSSVFIHWTNAALPSARELGLSDLVLSYDAPSPLMQAARKQGYRVFVEVSPQQAAAAATKAESEGWAGIILKARQSERAQALSAFANLRPAHPKLRFVVLDPDGKQPEMRGSLVIKRDAVLEVSSPTAQPWIDSNLALVRVEQGPDNGQVPMYSFSWNLPLAGQPTRTITAADYSLAVAEAGAFHADLILELDAGLQKALSQRDPQAWTLWKQVRSYAEFYSKPAQATLQAAADVAVVVDDLDPSDEAMNLMARHNIPFKVSLATNLQSEDLEGVDVVVVFAKAEKELAIHLEHLASQGKSVVVVDAHGSYPWQTRAAVQLNEHAVSYAVGRGKVLELSEPVSDPETFAQDIRRLIGNQNALLSLWNGLTTIAVPYGEKRGGLKTVELINYAQDPVRVQVKVKGSFTAIRYESPEHGCCKSLPPTQHDGFTEFVIPDLTIAGRGYLENPPAAGSGKEHQ